MTQFDPSIPALVPDGRLDYNGTSYEAVRANFNEVLLAATSVSASTAVTATCFGSGIIAWCEITSGLPPGSASTTIALKVQAIAPIGSNRFVTLGNTEIRSASGIVALAIHPAFPGTLSSNAYARFPGIVPRNFRVLASISSAAGSFGCVMALGISQVK